MGSCEAGTWERHKNGNVSDRFRIFGLGFVGLYPQGIKVSHMETVGREVPNLVLKPIGKRQ